MSKYGIFAIAGDEGSSRRYDEFLPPVPFSGFLVASKGDGKTTTVINLVEMYQGRLGFKSFDRIFVISSSINTDKKWKHLLNNKMIKKNDCFEDFDETMIKDFWDRVKTKNGDIPNDEKKSYLVIFDDVADKFPTSNENILKTFCFNHRHPFVSFLLISQSFKQIPSYARCNPSFWILFRSQNAEEHDKISSEVRGHLSKKEFTKLFLEATKKKHSFLFVDYSYKLNPKMLFRRNIDEMIDNGNKKFILDDNEVEEKEEIFQDKRRKTKEKDLVKMKKPKEEKEEDEDDEDKPELVEIVRNSNLSQIQDY